MTDWVTAYKIIKDHGKVRWVYRHQLYMGLLPVSESWLAWSAKAVR